MDKNYKVQQKGLQNTSGWWITKCGKSMLQNAVRIVVLNLNRIQNVTRNIKCNKVNYKVPNVLCQRFLPKIPKFFNQLFSIN